MSLDESTNSVWDLIEKLNTLRNKLVHYLDAEARSQAMEAVKTAYRRSRIRSKKSKRTQGAARGAITMCLGFVHAFEREVDQFKDFVNIMDRALSPHRHKEELPPGSTPTSD